MLPISVSPHHSQPKPKNGCRKFPRLCWEHGHSRDETLPLMGAHSSSFWGAYEWPGPTMKRNVFGSTNCITNL